MTPMRSTERAPLLSTSAHSLHHSSSSDAISIARSSSSHSHVGPLFSSESPKSSSSVSVTVEPHDASRDPHFAPGVARIDSISASITTTQRISLFLGIFLAGYAYGLEGQVRNAYQPYATASFNLHSYLATINVLRNVVAVVCQPTAAKLADVFGRFELIAVSTAIYSLGLAIEATASSVKIFCAGSITYQIGYTCLVLMMEVLVADFSSMRARVFFSYIPALPFLINTWISGSVTSAVLQVTTWRWGLGMWSIIYPIASFPLLLSLYNIEYRTRKNSDKPLQHLSRRSFGAEIFHLIDTVGLVSLVAAFSLILAPLTAIGDEPGRWQHPGMLATLATGLVCAVGFVLWERRGARKPLVPFHLLADRGVWSALAVRGLLNFAWSVQGTYLYTVLVVAFDFPIESATRIMSFFSFFGVLSGVAMGLVIYRLRRLKYIIVCGTCLFMVAFGLLIRFAGGASSKSQTGLISAQILLGLAGGFFAYPTQASIQASASREHVAIMTGLYLSFYNIGAAMGTCIAGMVWTQILHPTLESKLAFQPNRSLAHAIYDSPFDIIDEYPPGTDIRTAVIASYEHVQRVLCVIGCCLCLPMIGFALLLRNPKLSEDKVQPDAEEDVEA